MFQISFTFVAMLFLGSSLMAQSLSGIVLDPQGAGVPNARVMLYSRENGVRLNTTTNATGKYRFGSLAPGEYVVEAEASGFARARAAPIRLDHGTAKTLNLTLLLAGVREEVTVTAAGTAQVVDEVSKALTVVGRQEIEERDEFAVSETLRTTPGYSSICEQSLSKIRE
jgi:vitamin B12 transporter